MNLLVAQQNAPAMVVTLVDKAAPQTSLADVILASLGLTGVLVLIAAVLGLVLALLLVGWHRRHRPEDDHLPSVTQVGH